MKKIYSMRNCPNGVGAGGENDGCKNSTNCSLWFVAVVIYLHYLLFTFRRPLSSANDVEPAPDLCIAFESSFHIERGCQCLVYESNGRSEGVFSSVSYPHFYPINVDCILHTLIGDSDELVEVTFTDFNLQVPVNNRCPDFVRLYLDLDRPEVGEKQIANYELCGTGVSVPVAGSTSMSSATSVGGPARLQRKFYSSKRSLIVEFHTDSIQTNNTGFTAVYRFIDKTQFEMVDANRRYNAPCAYDFFSNRNAKSGSFFSPLYPQNYPAHSHCTYTFHGLPDELVRVTFRQILLGNGDRRGFVNTGHCNASTTTGSGFPGHVLVRDSTSSTILTTYCKDVSDVTVTSLGTGLTVEFRGNGRDEGPGFAATYEFIYRPARWQLQPPGSRKQDTSLRPMTDILSVNTLQAGDSPLVNLDQPSDTIVTDFPKKSSFDASACDETFISSSSLRNGSVTSPTYPSGYPANTNCRLTFVASGKNERVQLIFDDFDLYYPTGNPKEPDRCDEVDAVTVRLLDLDSSTGSRSEPLDIAMYCGSKRPPMLMSSAARIELHFVAGPTSAHESRGFSVAYKFVTDFGVRPGGQHEPDVNNGCRFAYRSHQSMNGTFTTPNFPGLYPRSTSCHYLFFGRESERVHIKFSYFDVEGVATGCTRDTSSDFVELSNFNVELTDRKMSRLCGSPHGSTSIPSGMISSYQSDSSFFRVTFHSNDVYDATGFDASYQFRPVQEFAEQRIAHEGSGRKIFRTSSSSTAFSVTTTTSTDVTAICLTASFIMRFYSVNNRLVQV